jgi:exodeoxyribonuclease V alpha subunit
MQTINDVHRQFAEYFENDALKPYAYLLSKRISEGHICISLDNIEADENIPEGYKSILNLRSPLPTHLVSSDLSEKRPFMVLNNKLYLQRYLQYETMILQRIQQFVSDEENELKIREQKIQKHASFIESLFQEISTEPNHIKPNWQHAAAISAVMNNFTIITGGPGTGKTTTVAKILSILLKEDIGIKIALAAPTGKAAARMAQSLKEASLPVSNEIAERLQTLQPSTIHRLLKINYNTHYFKHNSSNPIDADVVIIDESSMIDVALFAKLLDAIGPDTKLIMLGDKNQLASVEAGCLFGDLCEAQHKLNVFSEERAKIINSVLPNQKRILTDSHISSDPGHPLFQHVVELRESFRFKDNEGIGKISKAIIHNDVISITDFIENKNDKIVTIDDSGNTVLFNDFVLGYSAYIHETDISLALKKLNQLRVLCAVKEGEHGLFALNKKIEEQLISKKLIQKTGEYYINRPIMVTGNNYELELFNGDIGIVRKNAKGITMVYFEDKEGKLKEVLPGYITQSETVYAMTIHKSQGSEFDKVFMVLPERENIQLLTRELLYTGITRAKKQVFMQGKKDIILKSAAEKVKRASGIIERMVGVEKK